MNTKTKMKRVSFDDNVKIQNMHVWRFAYREARKYNWISAVLDRHRFELRKEILDDLLTEIGFFSKKCYKFDLRQQKMQSMLVKIGFFSRK